MLHQCGALTVVVGLLHAVYGKAPFVTASLGKSALLGSSDEPGALRNIGPGICHQLDYVPCGNPVTFCIFVLRQCDGIPDCPNGEDESPDLCAGRSCPPDTGSCLEDGACLPLSWICDGEEDCSAGSDEEGCAVSGSLPCHDLGPGAFQCDNDFCVPGTWRCDAFNDCGDGSDEANCSTCTQGYFQCAYSYEACVLESWVCDGYEDCADGSDELSCAACAEGEFRCEAGGCVDGAWRCDGEADCTDASDERACGGESPGCGKDLFDCGEGLCVPLVWRCDGFQDCDSGLDEAYSCDSVVCTDWQRPCRTSHGCLPVTWWCDGVADCADASDETSCHAAPDETPDVPQEAGGSVTSCAEDQFTCTGSGVCVSYAAVCDGRDDCTDASDESNCEFCVLDYVADHILIGHAFYFESEWSPEQCASECLSRRACMSLDYLAAREGAESMCYLNGVSHETHPDRFYHYDNDNHSYYYKVCATP